MKTKKNTVCVFAQGIKTKNYALCNKKSNSPRYYIKTDNTQITVNQQSRRALTSTLPHLDLPKIDTTQITVKVGQGDSKSPKTFGSSYFG